MVASAPCYLPGGYAYTRSVAVPLDVEGLNRPPLAALCPLRRPGVGVVLLSHCWLWGRGGLGTRCMHRPRAAYPGSLKGVAAPLTSLLCPCTTRHTLTGPILIPCSVVPPPRSSSSTYRILTPVFFLGPLRLVTSAYPPALLRCSPLASPVLHTLGSQQGFGRRFPPTAHPLQWYC